MSKGGPPGVWPGVVRGVRVKHYGGVQAIPLEEFEELVGQALDTLPPELMRIMDNVAVFVEDQKPGRPGLLGLYHGVPLTSRGHYYAGHLPDRITIYRLPICRVSANADAIVEQVRITVVHEIAHHFGISDERLHELGYG